MGGSSGGGVDGPRVVVGDDRGSCPPVGRLIAEAQMPARGAGRGSGGSGGGGGTVKVCPCAYQKLSVDHLFKCWVSGVAVDDPGWVGRMLACCNAAML